MIRTYDNVYQWVSHRFMSSLELLWHWWLICASCCYDVQAKWAGVFSFLSPRLNDLVTMQASCKKLSLLSSLMDHSGNYILTALPLILSLLQRGLGDRIRLLAHSLPPDPEVKPKPLSLDMVFVNIIAFVHLFTYKLCIKNTNRCSKPEYFLLLLTFFLFGVSLYMLHDVRNYLALLISLSWPLRPGLDKILIYDHIYNIHTHAHTCRSAIKLKTPTDEVNYIDWLLLQWHLSRGGIY